METRTLTQVKLYFLIMNMMRNKSESQLLVIVSDSREKIIQYYNDNMQEFMMATESIRKENFVPVNAKTEK